MFSLNVWETCMLLAHFSSGSGFLVCPGRQPPSLLPGLANSFNVSVSHPRFHLMAMDLQSRARGRGLVAPRWFDIMTGTGAAPISEWNFSSGTLSKVICGVHGVLNPHYIISKLFALVVFNTVIGFFQYSKQPASISLLHQDHTFITQIIKLLLLLKLFFNSWCFLYRCAR